MYLVFGNTTNFNFDALADLGKRQKIEGHFAGYMYLKKYVVLCFRWNIIKNLPLSQKQ